MNASEGSEESEVTVVVGVGGAGVDGAGTMVVARAPKRQVTSIDDLLQKSWCLTVICSCIIKIGL